MPQPDRLPSGGRIDRSQPVRFRFNGKVIEGFAGDTVASALLANGIRLVGRSFKYHRPRGIVSHGCDEPNALLDVARGAGRVDPNNRATVVEATDGLVVASQNHWPSLEHDLLAVNDRLSSIFVAGFYYKTFMWPAAFWRKFYEPMIRAVAGLGVAPDEPDPDRYVHRYAHCDVLVIGAGPAGLAAAMAASESGKRVMLVDEQSELGGTLLHEKDSLIDDVPTDVWLSQTAEVLKRRENVVVLTRTTAFGYYTDNFIGLVERVTDHLARPSHDLPRERLWQVRANQVVLATGAHERPLVFADNDRPGIMLAESIRVFINRYAVIPGRKIVFVTSGASAYRAASDARAAGLDVEVVDVRPESSCGPEVGVLRSRGVRVLTHHTVVGTSGRKRVNALAVALVSPDGRAGKRQTLACDCVGVSGGWTPAVHLFSQSRGKLKYEPTIDAFIPDVSFQAERSAGAARGTYDLAACLEEGWQAGLNATGRTGSRRFSVNEKTWAGFAPVRVLPGDAASARQRAFVDFQNDVTTKDIKLSVLEGFESIEHVKRYTTTGMGTDQGKITNMAALGVLSDVLSRPLPEIGTTTFRPPYTPVSFGALAGPSRGDLFDPIRKAPLHDWAVEHGAVFENVGLWRRAWYFPKPGEDMRAAVSRECKAVRTSVGVLDGSTLGKIEVVGPDAAEFLNRIYINDLTSLAPGKSRYGVMLKEDGYILDDGIVGRLAVDRFHVTTTTGGAARVLAHMEEYLQTEWPHLRVFLTSVTEQWAVIAVQGPRSRDVIAPLVTGIDLSEDAFPHMSVRTGFVCGIPTRLFRVSFTGELGYEINVPAGHAQAVWEAVFARGASIGIAPYGTEAMHVLRAERGFIIVGQETDGTVTPDDVGLGRMVSMKKTDFIGKRSLSRSDLLAEGRKQLVGILTESRALVLDEGAQIVADPRQPKPMKMLGHVTSSYWSETCGRSIALALVADGRARKDTTVHVSTLDGFAPARVVDPVFVDERGAGVHA
jgi:sarcosine oxidase subunit alpha